MMGLVKAELDKYPDLQDALAIVNALKPIEDDYQKGEFDRKEYVLRVQFILNVNQAKLEDWKSEQRERWEDIRLASEKAKRDWDKRRCGSDEEEEAERVKLEKEGRL